LAVLGGSRAHAQFNGTDDNPITTVRIVSGGDEVTGVIHCHTTFSDGFDTVESVAKMAKEHGAQFIVITDHLEDISLDSDEFDSFCPSFVLSLRQTRRIKKLTGISNYIQACSDATSRVGILVVPGIEVGIGTDRDRVYDPAGGDKWDNKVHMLGVGCVTEEVAQRISDYLGHNGSRTYSQSEKTIRLDEAQARIARILHEESMATIIAHPYLNDAIHGFHYTLYKNKVEEVDGIEFFNENFTSPDFGDEKALEAFGVTGRDSAMGSPRNFAVTSGCDYHGIPGTGGDELFKRQTVLYPGDKFMKFTSIKARYQLLAVALIDRNLPTLALADRMESSQWTLDRYFKNGEEVTSNVAPAITRGAVYGFENDRCIAFFPKGINNGELQTDGGTDTQPQQTPEPQRNDEIPFEQFGDIHLEKPNDRWSINVAGIAPGGTSTMNLVFENTTARDLTLDFLPGMIFVAVDDVLGVKRQPLVIVEHRRVTVPANQAATFEIKTACANHAVSAPSRDTVMVYAGYNPVLGSVIVESTNAGRGVQGDIWKYTDDNMWHGNWTRYKAIRVENNSTNEMKLFLAWHDENGWHNTNFERYWSFIAGESASLAEDDIRIHADMVRYWAQSTDNRYVWRQDKKNDTVDLQNGAGKVFTASFE